MAITILPLLASIGPISFGIILLAVYAVSLWHRSRHQDDRDHDGWDQANQM